MLKNIENPLKSTADALDERINNPISGIFILSWIIVNWKIPILLVFATVPEKDRLTEIESYLVGAGWMHLLIIPILTAALYLFLIPLLREYYLAWLNKSDFRIKRDKLQIESDLNEVKDYRETLAAINAFLKNEFKKYSENTTALLDLAHDVITNWPEEEVVDPKLIQIKKELEQNKDNLERIVKSYENFFSRYSGTLPEMYSHYETKWKRFSKNNL
jgi:hypothetical protein